MTGVPGSDEWLRDQTRGLLDFALRAVAPEGGFGWLDEDGNIDRVYDRELWITCRMTHVCAIGTLLGHPGCREGLDHGVRAIETIFSDHENGGWYTAVGWDGSPTDDSKAAYPHAFVILAASSAVAAGHTDALPLLREAIACSTAHFWDDEYHMIVEEWDRAFTQLDRYRGVNANMHTVEAYLAAADALDLPGVIGEARTWAEPGADVVTSADREQAELLRPRRREGIADAAAGGAEPGATVAEILRNRAYLILDRVINREARANGWRIPEHFDTAWQPLPDFNRDHPADPFRPYGATVGHGLEWARLCLQAQASLSDSPDWMGDAATALYDRALADGWAVDGADGFVYTTDWDGLPVVHERMHWVLAEALNTAFVLAKLRLCDTAASTAQWWAYADECFIDHVRGSWRHELDRHNQASATVWAGKPDVYHAIQATVLPSLPVAPAIVSALALR
ncbi:MAG: AGE family epimerase/isomerase [Propionibacteriaceae bacterium]|nr:AGE family epimerase/isomerase [Propionibacteriaceae bacterium]